MRQHDIPLRATREDLSTSSSSSSSSWKSLAEEWAEVNRDKENGSSPSSSIHPRTTIVSNGVDVVRSRSSYTAANGHHSANHINGEYIDSNENDNDDTEEHYLQEIQRQAAETYQHLVQMDDQVNGLVATLQQRQVEHEKQLLTLQLQLQREEQNFTTQYQTLARDYQVYQQQSQREQAVALQRATAVQDDLKNQVLQLQRDVTTQMQERNAAQDEVQALQTQQVNMQAKMETLQNETAALIASWQERLESAQSQHAVEMKRAEEQALQQEEVSAQRHLGELNRVEQARENERLHRLQTQDDLEQRLQTLQHEVRERQTQVQRAQEQVQAAHGKIENELQPALQSYQAWTEASWELFNCIEETLGRTPITPNPNLHVEDAEGYANPLAPPSIDILQQATSDLIQDFRLTEEYFEDSIQQLEYELQMAQEELQQSLNDNQQLQQQQRIEQEQQQQAQEEYARAAAANTATAAAAAQQQQSQWQAKVELLQDELHEQTTRAQEQSRRAAQFQHAQVQLQRELIQLKAEAALVIVELEELLTCEQEARHNATIAADVRLQQQRDEATQTLDQVVETKQELSTRVQVVQRELQHAHNANSAVLSLGLSACLLALLVWTGVGARQQANNNNNNNNMEPPVQQATKPSPNNNKMTGIASSSSPSFPFVSEYNNKLLQSTTTTTTATKTDRSATATSTPDKSVDGSSSFIFKGPSAIKSSKKSSSPPAVYMDEDGFYDWGLLSKNYVADYEKTMQEKQKATVTAATKAETSSSDNTPAMAQKRFSIKTATGRDKEKDVEVVALSLLSKLTESVATTAAYSKDTTTDTRTTTADVNNDKENAAPKSGDKQVSAEDVISASSGSLNDPLLIRAIVPPIGGDPFAADPLPSPTAVTEPSKKTATTP
jgi:hypothetical protein